ncbi:MAG: motility associated factor glycosyltransferase family protein [Brevinema sp.]
MELIKKLRSLNKDCLINTPDGAFTFKENNKFVHSTRAPIKEATRLLEKITPTDLTKTIILLWGVGLGYHAEILLKKGYSIIAIEPRPEVAKIFKKIFPADLLISLIENQPEDLFNTLANLNPANAEIFIDIMMPGVKIDTDFLKMAEQGKNVLRSTHRIHSLLIDSWYKNILKNIQHASVTFTPLFKDQEVIICSAGPSLRESLPYLKTLSQHNVILAVDTALKSLLEAEIIPDYVFSVDAKIHNISDFCGISNEIFAKIILLADITVNHQIASLPWKQVLFTTTVQPLTTTNGLQMKLIKLLTHFKDYGINFLELQTGGSVANTAFHAAIVYEANKILLVGQDLAYSNLRGHSVGSPYDQEYRLQTNRLNTLETIHIKKVPFKNEVTDIFGDITYSDELLMQFQSWFEVSIKTNPSLATKVINASEHGAYFKYWNHLPLSKYSNSQYLIKKSPLITLKTIDQNIIKQCMKFLKKEEINLESEHSLIQEYFYKEHNDSSTLKNIKQKTKSLQKLIGE